MPKKDPQRKCAVTNQIADRDEEGNSRQFHLYQVVLDPKEANEHNKEMADKFEEIRGHIPLMREEAK